MRPLSPVSCSSPLPYSVILPPTTQPSFSRSHTRTRSGQDQWNGEEPDVQLHMCAHRGGGEIDAPPSHKVISCAASAENGYAARYSSPR